MTYREDFTLPAELLEQVQEQGLDVLPELIRVIINTAMQAERTEHLNAGPYQPGYGYCLTCEDFIYDGWVRRNGRAPEFRQKADATVDKFTEDGDSIVTAKSLISMILYK